MSLKSGEEILNWLRRFAPKRGVVGLELLADGMALAARNETGLFQVLAMFNKNLHQDQTATEFLRAVVEKHGLESESCHLVLPQGSYQLLLVEAPDVPEDELREAIRWRIKDLISIPLENAALDIFLLPDNASRGKRMVYVVVADLSYLQSCIELVSEGGLRLKSIDIGELALRNISLLKEEGRAGGRGLGMIRINAGAGNVSLYQEGNLYLSRSFQVNYKGGLLDELPEDNLMLEIQRSLDYYERQMGQRPPAALYVFGENISDDKLGQDFRRGLTGDVKVLQLGDYISESDDVPTGLIAPCLAAIGASLRGQVSP